MTIAKEIIEGILAVRKNITSIKHDAKNPHGGYSYVSIDTYYEKIATVATAAGLAWRTRELSFELIPNQGKNKDRTFVQSKFVYDVMAKDKVCEDYMSVTILSPIDGPQTTGQLFSYADKVFMRVAFCVSTGEQDADSTQQAPISINKGAYDPILGGGVPIEQTMGLDDKPKPSLQNDDLSLDDPPHDPTTGEILPETPSLTETDVISKMKEDLPLIDTRKVIDGSTALVEKIFTTFMPKITSPAKLKDWHAENLAAIEKVKNFDPAAYDRIKASFNSYNKQLKEKK